MAQNHQSKEDYCLECHWESFHLDGKDDGSSAGPQPQQPSSEQQEACPRADHHALTTTTTTSSSSSSHCDGEEECCEEDDCSTTCPSVCDGFVDCDDSTACSVLHCDENHCESHDPVCFDNHCFTEDEHTADHGLESFLGLEQPFSLEANDLLPSLALEQQQQQPHHQGQQQQQQQHQHQLQLHQSKPDESGTVGSFFHPYSSCQSHMPNHHGSLMHHPTYPVQNDVNPADVFHMLGMCSDFSTCHMPEEQQCHSHPLNDSTNPFPCFHTEHGNNENNNFQNTHHHNHLHHDHLHEQQQHHLHQIHHHQQQHQHQHQHHQIKPPTSRPTKGPCRSHHRCRVHAHAHAHPYSAHSRHSRSSISSHLIPSPGETPPPLDGGASSVITSPEFSPVDRDSFVCKWTTTSPSGMRASCGVSFADAGALQKHLIACHMSTVDGAKGNGYYCCWEGCHRPDEPFSQKSKLQGHFLTHSNCTLSSSLPPPFFLFFFLGYIN